MRHLVSAMAVGEAGSTVFASVIDSGAKYKREQRMPTAAARNENIEKLRDLIKGIKVAMLTTSEENGRLFSRPMATQEQDFDGDLWFFSKESSPKVEEVEK